jgi:BASS family bile acid:Na+ symporter
MDLKAAIPDLILISTMLLIFSVGLQSRWRDLAHILVRPILLFRGFVAVYVAVPVVGFAAAMLLPIEPAIRVCIVAMALSPLAPFAPGKMLQSGVGRSYVVGMYVGLILLAAVAVPATLLLVAAVAGGTASIRIGSILWLVATTILLPLLAGMTFGSFALARAQRVAQIVSVAATLTLAILVSLILVADHAQILGLIGNGTMVAIVLAELAGLACGHVLGGPDPRRRIALAQAAASRHPGIAVLMLRQNFEIDSRMLAAVLLYLVLGMVVSTLYVRWARRRLPEDRTAEADPIGVSGFPIRALRTADALPRGKSR